MNLKTEKPIKSKTSQATIIAENVFNAMGLKYSPEMRFCPGRKWRVDYYLPLLNVILEIEGGIYIKGRHTNPIGFINDCEKYNRATIMGFKVLRYVATEIERTNGQNILNDLSEMLGKYKTASNRI